MQKNFWLIGIYFFVFFLTGCAVQEETSETINESWDANLSLEQIESEIINNESIFSSGKLKASWNAPEKVDHYEISLTDGVTNASSLIALEDTESTILTGLKSQTEYTLNLTACLDADCENSLLADNSATASTSAEYWQMQGSGNGYDSATKVVDVGMGSTLSYVLPYGSWAPKSLQGLVKYYFNANSLELGRGMLISVNETGENDINSLKSFDITGLFYERDCEDVGQAPNQVQAPNVNQKKNTQSSDGCNNGELQMMAFQMVPLSNGSVRLFFEASKSKEGTNSQPLTQIYSLDSQDGYVAEDFNPDENKGYCSATDMVEGGVCEATPLIGQDTGADSPIFQARQHKIGYPKQDSWLWDESEGTFMILTGQDTCDQTRDGLFYAIWDGETWNVESNDDGCAQPLVLDAHGPVIVHLGDSNYKVYYENYEFTDKESFQFETKPFRVLYGAGTQSDDENTLELSDWENESEAREVYFLWPDGTMLDDQEEAGLGDHLIWSPDEDLETQIMYMNLGGFDNKDLKQPPVGLGMAVLVNP